MRKYARYKDSGISWIGEVPEHWETKRIRHIFNESDEKVEDDSGELLSLSQYTGVSLKKNCEKSGMFEAETTEGYKVVHKNQFVMNIMLAWNGSYAVSNLEGVISPAYCVFDFIIDCEPKFFHYLLRIKAYSGAFKTLSKGIIDSRLRLYPSKFYTFPVIVPPLSEQKAIAEYLDKKTAQINELVSAKQKQIELLKEYKQSVIANAVTGKLNEKMGLRLTNESREEINWIGNIPGHWQKRKFQYLFKERSEKNHPEEPVLCATQSRGVIPQSMYENRVVVVNTGFDGLKFVKKGDFVISLRSFQGGIEYAYYQGIISAAYTILYINTKDLYSDYVRLLFKSVPFIGLLQTCVTGIREGQNINNDLLRKQIIPIPPLSEQKEIVAYIEKKVSSIDSQIASIENQIANLNEYKHSLISDVVTGKVKVC